MNAAMSGGVKNCPSSAFFDRCGRPPLAVAADAEELDRSRVGAISESTRTKPESDTRQRRKGWQLEANRSRHHHFDMRVDTKVGHGLLAPDSIEPIEHNALGVDAQPHDIAK